MIGRRARRGRAHRARPRRDRVHRRRGAHRSRRPSGWPSSASTVCTIAIRAKELPEVRDELARFGDEVIAPTAICEPIATVRRDESSHGSTRRTGRDRHRWPGRASGRGVALARGQGGRQGGGARPHAVEVRGGRRRDRRARRRRRSPSGATSSTATRSRPRSQQVVAEWGRIDLLVNNAQIEVLRVDPQAHRRRDGGDVAVGADGGFRFMQACFPHLRTTKGCVINMGSGSGILPHGAMSGYAMAKEAVRTLAGSAPSSGAASASGSTPSARSPTTPGLDEFDARPAPRGGDRAIPLGRWGDTETRHRPRGRVPRRPRRPVHHRHHPDDRRRLQLPPVSASGRDSTAGGSSSSAGSRPQAFHASYRHLFPEQLREPAHACDGFFAEVSQRGRRLRRRPDVNTTGARYRAARTMPRRRLRVCGARRRTHFLTPRARVPTLPGRVASSCWRCQRSSASR